MFKLGRNPYTRETVTKEKVNKPITALSCFWCGNTDKRGNVYKFKVPPDSIQNRDYFIKGEFCSVECARIFHGI